MCRLDDIEGGHEYFTYREVFHFFSEVFITVQVYHLCEDVNSTITPHSLRKGRLE